MFSSTDLKQRWWMHRDQKLAYDPVRDAEHVRAHPNAFSVTRCYQSSLYLTDSVDEGDDGFVCCPGSHAWPDGDGWKNSRDRHHVSVPPDDPRVVRAVSKLVVRRGEMIVWDSRLAHMGGYLRPPSTRATRGLVVGSLRLALLDPSDDQAVRASLDENGVCLVKIATEDEMRGIEKALCADLSRAYDLPLLDEWRAYPSHVFGRPNKGGGSWAPVACGRAACEARLLPKRVDLFRALLGTQDVVVSIDSVHWTSERNRLCFMASFCDRKDRSDEAYKRKCVCQAYGLTRTTHWANTGHVSLFNYGGERNKFPQQRFEIVSRGWKGHGAISPAPERIRRTYVKRLARVVSDEAARMSTDEAIALLDPAVSCWL